MAMSRFERKMKEYEVLLEALKTSIIVSEQGLKWYKDNANIEVGDKKVSSELLKRLLTDEDYYEYVEKLFNNEIDKYTVNAIVDLEESKDPITLSKVEIVKGIKICLQRKLFKLDELGEARLKELEEKLRKQQFDLEDFLEQMQQVKNRISSFTFGMVHLLQTLVLNQLQANHAQM